MSARARSALPVLAVVAFAAAFFAPELFAGRVAMTANMTRWLPWARAATPEQIAAPSHNPDCATSYYPRRALLRDAARDGVVPLWNPYTFGGTPFLADPQSGVLYPPNWLLLPFHPRTQMGLFLFLHVAWGGIGVALLVRRFAGAGGGAGAPAASGVAGATAVSALAGCAFVANGYFAKHFGQPPFLATAAWVPWTIAAALAVVDRPDRGRTTRLALAGAMLFLAGQPQTAFHAVYATLVVVAVTALVRGGRPARPGHVLAALAGAGVLALLLVGAQLLPTLDLATRSARSTLPWTTVLSGAFHPVDAIRAAVPDFFGSPLTGDEWSPLFPRGDGFYLRNQLNSVFAGTPLLVLALWAACAPRTRRAALPWTVLLAVAVLLAFGTPLARLAWNVLPGFRFSRIDRVGFLVVLAQAVLAGIGAADLARPAGRGRRVVGVTLLVAAAAAPLLVAAAGPSLPRLLGADPAIAPPAGLDAATVARTVARTRLAALFCGGTAVAFLLPASRAAALLPLALAAVQLALFASPFRGDRRPEEVFAPDASLDRLAFVLAQDAGRGGGRFVRFGRDLPVRPWATSAVLPPTTNAPYHLRDLQGYNALADRRLGETLETALGEDVFSHGIWAGRRIVAPERPASMEHPILDALAVRAAIGATPFAAAGWESESLAGFRMWHNREALPRVRLVPAGRGVDEATWARLLEEGAFDPRREAPWVGEGRAGEEPAAGEPAPDPGHVELLADGWNDIAVRTRTEGERILVVADAWSPGWTARVDGRPAAVLPVYGVVRGVVVPAGDHRIDLVYRPEAFRRGALLSILGLLAAGTALAWPAREP